MRLLGRPNSIWNDNIRMDLKETGLNTGNSVDSAQDRDYWRALVSCRIIPQSILAYKILINGSGQYLKHHSIRKVYDLVFLRKPGGF